MLDEINRESVELLKDKQISPAALRVLPKVKLMRQIVIAELMVSANNYTKGYGDRRPCRRS